MKNITHYFSHLKQNNASGICSAEDTFGLCRINELFVSNVNHKDNTVNVENNLSQSQYAQHECKKKRTKNVSHQKSNVKEATLEPYSTNQSSHNLNTVEVNMYKQEQGTTINVLSHETRNCKKKGINSNITNKKRTNLFNDKTSSSYISADTSSGITNSKILDCPDNRSILNEISKKSADIVSQFTRDNRSSKDVTKNKSKNSEPGVKCNSSKKKRKSCESIVDGKKRTKEESNQSQNYENTSNSDSSSDSVILTPLKRKKKKFSANRSIHQMEDTTDQLRKCDNELNKVNKMTLKCENNLLKYFNKETSPIIDSNQHSDINKTFGKRKKLKTETESKPKGHSLKVDEKNNKQNDLIQAVNKEQLASIFLNKCSKNKPNDDNPEKQEFLNSGVPDIVKKRLALLKSTNEEYNGEYSFPCINHVRQFSGTNHNSAPPQANKMINFRPVDITNYMESFSRKFSFSVNTSDYIPRSQLEYNKKLSNVKREIDHLKKQEPSCNVSEIREFINKAHKSVKKSPSKSVNEISSMDWTEKYKPFSYEGILGNKANIIKLRSWIESHKRECKNIIDDDSSDNDFLSCDENSNHSIKTKNNVAVLVGPPGCGKTCAVYTIAKEFGFEVLEINAGSNRNGKRILSELLESTQSHQVKHDVTLFKNHKSKKCENIETSKRVMSLILIEDANILFEKHDEGYLSAINSIIELSKRPIIFIASDIHSPHIAKYNNSQHLVLHFKYHSWCQLSVWLQIIALTEGVKLSNDVLQFLLCTAGSDVRKNLLQMQMLILSKLQFSASRFIQNSSVFKNDMKFEDSTENSVDEKNTEISKRKSMEHYSNHLQQISVIDTLEPAETDFDELHIHKRANDICMDPQYSENYLVDHLRYEFYNYCRNNISSKYDSELSSLKKLIRTKRQREDIYNSCKNALSSIIPKHATNYVGVADYLPTIRAISRLEKDRLSCMTRRTSRYFNYLKSVGVNISDYESNILIESLM